jgi:hypothetical protein
MKFRRRTVLLSVGLLVVVAVVCSLPAVRWRMHGWRHGEAFFQGRPSSYWSHEIRTWNDTHAQDRGFVP